MESLWINSFHLWVDVPLLIPNEPLYFPCFVSVYETTLFLLILEYCNRILQTGLLYFPLLLIILWNYGVIYQDWCSMSISSGYRSGLSPSRSSFLLSMSLVPSVLHLQKKFQVDLNLSLLMLVQHLHLYAFYLLCTSVYITDAHCNSVF